MEVVQNMNYRKTKIEVTICWYMYVPIVQDNFENSRMTLLPSG